MKFIKATWFVGKLWVMFCLLTIVGQVRVGGDTLESQWHDYFQKPKISKFFNQFLYPVHWSLHKAGFNVGWDEMQRKLAWVPSPDEQLKERLGNVSQEQFEKVKAAAEAQKKMLEGIEADLSN
jgi:hypothetical protein